MLIARPTRDDDLIVVQCLELSTCELRSLTELFYPEEVLHTALTGLTRAQLKETINETISKFSLLTLTLFIKESNSLLQLSTVLLRSLRVELGIDDNTTE